MNCAFFWGGGGVCVEGEVPLSSAQDGGALLVRLRQKGRIVFFKPWLAEIQQCSGVSKTRPRVCWSGWSGGGAGNGVQEYAV